MLDIRRRRSLINAFQRCVKCIAVFVFGPSEGPSIGVEGVPGAMHSLIILMNRENGLRSGF